MVRERRLAVYVAFFLVVAGASCLLVRLRVLPRPQLEPGESLWRLTYDIDLTKLKTGRVQVAIPDNTAHARIFRESFSHQGIWMDILRTRTTHGREVVIVPLLGRERGHFLAEFDVRLSRETRWAEPFAKSELSAQETAHFLRHEPTVQVKGRAVVETLAQLGAAGGDRAQLLERIFEHCAERIVPAEPDGPQDANETLQQGRGTGLGRARALVALCRAARLPARLVTGFSIEESPEPRLRYWVEVRSKKRWRSCDAESGYFGESPSVLLPVTRDGDKVIRAPGIADHRARYTMDKLRPAGSSSVRSATRWTEVMDLTRLPPGMQQTLTLLLLLPFGALVTALFRNVVGIQTFGTFTPTLIALSFVQADWRTGTAVCLSVLLIGLSGRFLLNRLRLLLVARLSVILTLIVLCMVGAVSVLDYLGLTPSASAVLLPMVILTMMVERVNVTMEEDGCAAVLKALAGTVVVAVCCFWVLRIHSLSRLALTFPEVHAFTVAVLILVGRYSGYRLTEWWRFRDLAGSDSQEPV
jgi:transglutaminase-like putative cysteine protease